MDKWTIRPARTGDFEAVVRMIAELMDYQGLEGETPSRPPCWSGTCCKTGIRL